MTSYVEICGYKDFLCVI